MYRDRQERRAAVIERERRSDSKRRRTDIFSIRIRETDRQTDRHMDKHK